MNRFGDISVFFAQHGFFQGHSQGRSDVAVAKVVAASQEESGFEISRCPFVD